MFCCALGMSLMLQGQCAGVANERKTEQKSLSLHHCSKTDRMTRGNPLLRREDTSFYTSSSLSRPECNASTRYAGFLKLENICLMCLFTLFQS